MTEVPGAGNSTPEATPAQLQGALFPGGAIARQQSGVAIAGPPSPGQRFTPVAGTQSNRMVDEDGAEVGPRGYPGFNSAPNKNKWNGQSVLDDAILMFSYPAASLGHGGLGVFQGGANTINGIQDTGVGLINVGIYAFNSVVGDSSQVKYLESSDWSYNLITTESVSLHNASKILGASGVIDLATGGIGKIGAVNKAICYVGKVVQGSKRLSIAAKGFGYAGKAHSIYQGTKTVGNSVTGMVVALNEGDFATAATHAYAGITASLSTVIGLQTKCFAAGTPLLTPDGSKPIERFQPGDAILTRDEHDPDAAPAISYVVRTLTNVTPLLTLVVGGRAIETTAEHPFWVQGRGWTDAGLIKVGNLLVGHDGRPVMVTAIEAGEAVATVYNLEVANYHTYFVGDPSWDFSVWAHNDSCFRALTAEDAAAFKAGEKIIPKGKGGTIIDHIQGNTDTKYISVSMTKQGTAKYIGSEGVVELDLDILKQTGSGIVPYEQILQVARRHGRPIDVRNVIDAQEFLITGGIDPTAIISLTPGN